GGVAATRRAASHDLFLQVVDAEEVAVVGCEVHVGSVVQLPQALHNEVTDLGRRQLHAAHGVQLDLDVVQQRLDLRAGHGQLGAGAGDADAQLFARVLLATAVFFDHVEVG